MGRSVWVALPAGRRAALLAAALPLMYGCSGGEDAALHCRDLLPPAAAPFAAVFALVSEPGGPGCVACHNTEVPLLGLNFEGPAVAHDALATKMHAIYPQLSSAAMPQDGEPWDDQKLRLLRSWYCHGAFYEVD